MEPDHYLKISDYLVGPGAKLYAAQMRDFDLSHLDLRKADLRMADLRGANFTCSDLRGALLQGALPSGANFTFANVQLPNEYKLQDGIAFRVKPSMLIRLTHPSKSSRI